VRNGRRAYPGCRDAGLVCYESIFPSFNRDKILRMALIHDLGEVFTGDLTPDDQVAPGEKRRRERESVTRVVSRLPRGREYIDLWRI